MNKESPGVISIKSMNDLSPLKRRVLAGIGLTLIAAAIYLVRVPIVYAGPPAAPEKPAESSTLSGATLYAINCNRCHAERYPPEFTVANWRNIMIHMRVRANLPAAQAREILKYLEEDAGK
jgi:mono/diheme cytochrome c family protein